MEEVNMDEPNMLDDSLLSGVKADIYESNYKDNMSRWKKRMGFYKSNKSAMCSVVKLHVTDDWEANKTDLFFVLKAVQLVCIGV